MRITASITLGGKRVENNVPYGSKAWRLANSIFSPVGPAPTRGWFVMTKLNLDDLDTSGPVDVVWHQKSDNLRFESSYTFSGLYVVGSGRLLTGDVGANNSLHLVELADARYLIAKNGDTGNIIRNMRSYANNSDYLTGTSGTTWESLVEELWDECGLLGEFPGLPFAPDSVPENNWLVGLNSWKALCTVLDQLDCAIAHNPFDDVYTIIQLGGDQEILDQDETLQWDGEPGSYNTDVAANLRIYFRYHRKAYGQERDTELSSNWVFNGTGDTKDRTTGVTGAIGRKALWDDMPWVLDENGAHDNAAAIETRADNRKSRYVTRHTVESKHRIHSGISDLWKPGAKIRAVLWRNWNDGVDGKPGFNKLGGTVTEFIAGSNLVTDLHSSGLAECVSVGIPAEAENYSPPDIARPSHPVYPRLPNVVQVNNSGASAGETVQPDASGFHKGRVRRWVSNAMATLDDCFIRFVDQHDTLNGQIPAVQGEFYGPARLSGISTSGAETLPVYLVRKGGDGTGPIVFELTSILSPNGEAQAVILHLVAGVYVSSGIAITVIDGYAHFGLWRGPLVPNAARGIAHQRTDGKYEIEFIEMLDGVVEFTVVEPSGGWVSHQLQQDVTFTHSGQQGDLGFKPAPEQGNNIVYDVNDLFPYAVPGAKGIATYDYFFDEYRITMCQQMSLHAEAILASDMCDPGLVAIGEFAVTDFSPFNLDPFEIPVDALNVHFLRGMAGDKVFLKYEEGQEQWVIKQVDHHPQFVPFKARIFGNWIQWWGTICAMMYCKPPEWVNMIPLDPTCPEDSEGQ